MEKITKEQMETLKNLVAGHNTIRYGVLHSNVHQTVENHTNRMLALAPILADIAGLKFDNNKLNALILLHDLSELGMKQDITLQEQMENENAKTKKDEIERKTKVALIEKYGDWMFKFFTEYEEQSTEISRFIKWLDKYEASLYMLEIDLFSEINLKNFYINTLRLIDTALKIPPVINFTLKHLNEDLYKIWQRNNKLNEFNKLHKSLVNN